MPAEAGIQTCFPIDLKFAWIPAAAEMTLFLGTHERSPKSKTVRFIVIKNHARFSDHRSSRPHRVVGLSLEGSDTTRMAGCGAAADLSDGSAAGSDFSRQLVDRRRRHSAELSGSLYQRSISQGDLE